MAETYIVIDNRRWFYDTGNPAEITRLMSLAGSTSNLTIPVYLSGSMPVTSIPDGMCDYVNDRSYTSITLHGNIYHIGVRAFAENSGSSEIHIPASVASIGAGFIDGSRIQHIYFEGDTPTIGACLWPIHQINGDEQEPLGHAYSTSNFPAPGQYWNGLKMGSYIGSPPISDGRIRVKGLYRRSVAPQYSAIQQIKHGFLEDTPEDTPIGPYHRGYSTEYGPKSNFRMHAILGQAPYTYRYNMGYMNTSPSDVVQLLYPYTDGGAWLEFIAGSSYNIYFKGIYIGGASVGAGAQSITVDMSFDRVANNPDRNGVWRWYVNGVLKASAAGTIDDAPNGGIAVQNSLLTPILIGFESSIYYELNPTMIDPGSGTDNVYIRGITGGVSPNVRIYGA